jgi:integrase
MGTEMTTIKLKGVNKVLKRLASGGVKRYYYHRATGTLLPGLPGSADFLEAYKDADRTAPRDAGTVAGLIRVYQASPKFVLRPQSAQTIKKKHKPLAQSTAREYKRLLTHLEKKFGTMPIAALAAPRVVGKFLDYHEEIGLDHPREADNRLTILAIVFSYAKRKGLIVRNPLEGFDRLYEGDRSDMIWMETEIEKFMDGAPIQLQRALILALHTGQRYGDLVRLRWSDYDGTYIRLKQSKTKAKVTVKVSAALKRMLDSTPKTCLYILAREDGRPWFTEKDDKALGKAWREQMETAGLYHDDPAERLHFNDIRGTSVTLLSEAGCTIQEVASITGHTLKSANQILEKYLSRTQTLSDAAILKFENAKATAFANRLQTSASA